MRVRESKSVPQIRGAYRTKGLSLLLCALFVITGGTETPAQYYFGQNKVQYTDFQWRVLTTEHFKIYYYESEEEISGIAAKLAEESYDALRVKFNHEIFAPIPLVIYSSPIYFSQTNTTPGMISESTGGFTEFLKGRMVLPYTGSYSDFAHVIRHELVHVFMLSKLARVQHGQRTLTHSLPPLWFIEGLAERWSTHWDSQADMLVRDMVMSGNILSIPDFWRVSGSFLMYKLGQSVCGFIEEEYGSDKLTMILENSWKSENFDEVVKFTLGESLAEVSKKWEYSLKKEYYPLIADGELTKSTSKQLTFDGYAVKSAPIHFDNNDGAGEREWIVYKADKLGYSSLYMMSGKGERSENHTLLRGERSADFESLHFLRSSIDAISAGFVAFTSKANESDALYIFDLKDRRITKQIKLDGVVSLQSPRFSPDGQQVVVAGERDSGESDLYIVNIEDETARQLTHDIYQETDPAFSTDGRFIYYASDKGPWGDTGARDIVRLDIDEGSVTTVTRNKYIDRSPEPTDSGLFFTSDRDGVSNVYFLDRDGNFSQVTHSVVGVSDARISPENGDLLYTGYQDFQYYIFKHEADSPAVHVEREEFVDANINAVAWEPVSLKGPSVESNVAYENDYSLDVAQTAVSYDPIYGTLGGIQLMMSDMLGDHIYYGFISNSAETKDDILTSFNVGLTYYNLKKRVNWAVGAFHFYDRYYNDVDGDYFERQLGGYGQLRYPLSRFERIETTFYARYRDKDRFLYRDRRQNFLISNYFSFVSDNSLWTSTGPIDGHRINLTVGVTTAVDESAVNDIQMHADLRNYYRLGRNSAWAIRAFGYHSSGIDPRRIYFGGSWNFRGFGRRHWYAPNVLFLSNEIRFPLINRLILGLPIGNVGFSGIQGALFYDTGSLWEDEFDQFVGSFGFGARVSLAYLIAFRFDWSWRHDYRRVESGPDFDFFFGWNF